MTHIIVWQQRELRRSLVRHLLRLHLERGTEWLRGYVKGWKMWENDLRIDFWRQHRLGNDGEPEKWL